MRKKLTKEQSRYTTNKDEDKLTKTQGESRVKKEPKERLDAGGDLKQSREGKLGRKWKNDTARQHKNDRKHKTTSNFTGPDTLSCWNTQLCPRPNLRVDNLRLS